MAQGFAYAPLQREAIRMALSNRVMVLTGGPGHRQNNDGPMPF